MNFEKAIEELKKGKKLARAGWGDKRLYVVELDAKKATKPFINKKTQQIVNKFFSYDDLPVVGLIYGPKKFLTSWVVSLVDMIAEDWEVID